MRLHANEGRRDALDRTMKELTARLDELGLDPSPETLQPAGKTDWVGHQ